MTKDRRKKRGARVLKVVHTTVVRDKCETRVFDNIPSHVHATGAHVIFRIVRETAFFIIIMCYRVASNLT